MLRHDAAPWRHGLVSADSLGARCRLDWDCKADSGAIVFLNRVSGGPLHEDISRGSFHFQFVPHGSSAFLDVFDQRRPVLNLSLLFVHSASNLSVMNG